jgi:branched-subunit amino acid aminotransferase/4-amino-4-deoxychorismate lyase
MDSRFDKLFEMVLEIRDKTTQNTAVLDEHMRRTDASERRLEIQEHKLDTFMTHIEGQLEPVKNHVNRVGWTVKMVIYAGAGLGAALGIIEGLRKIL